MTVEEAKAVCKKHGYCPGAPGHTTKRFKPGDPARAEVKEACRVLFDAGVKLSPEDVEPPAPKAKKA